MITLVVPSKERMRSNAKPGQTPLEDAAEQGEKKS